MGINYQTIKPGGRTWRRIQSLVEPVANFANAYFSEHGWAPTAQEMSEATGEIIPYIFPAVKEARSRGLFTPATDEALLSRQRPQAIQRNQMHQPWGGVCPPERANAIVHLLLTDAGACDRLASLMRKQAANG